MSDFKVGDKVRTKDNIKCPLRENDEIIASIKAKTLGEIVETLFPGNNYGIVFEGYDGVFALNRTFAKYYIEPGYPLSFQEALKAAIDGKVVEDEYGVLVCFDIDKCRFIVDSGNEKTEMKGEGLFKDKSEYKYRIYEPKPKFKRGDFVVWDEMYYRILNVNQIGSKFTYDLVYNQHKFNTSKSQHEDIDESELDFS